MPRQQWRAKVRRYDNHSNGCPVR